MSKTEMQRRRDAAVEGPKFLFKRGSFDNLEFQEAISKGSLEFDEWTLLISEIEKIYPDDMEKICLVYDHFLSNFPMCYGYWRKYALHMTRLCAVDKVVKVFERALLSATYSVGLWVDYCCFAMSAFEDPSDIRRLFRRAISFVGKDYLCHTFWDKYIHFEYSQQQWISLAHIYIQTLKFPTKKLHQYYDSFKKLVVLLEEGMASQGNSTDELQSEPCFDGDIPMYCKEDKIYCIIKDMMDSSIGLTRSIALKKYRIIGERLYHNACKLDAKISSFEAKIHRYFFHVRPLDANQLQNWHDYLDFIELQGDFDWAVKLYERCLIVCANYPEYWMRYVDYMETKGGREIANYSLDRATDVYLKRLPEIHLFNARFREQIGDIVAARAAYIQSGKETDTDFVESVVSKANMEKRLGNMESAFRIYKEALEMALAEETSHTFPILYVHFSRLKYMATNNVDAARDVLVDGIRKFPQSKLLLEELIKFSIVHGGPMHVAVIDSIVADAISDGSQGLSTEDAKEISNLYLEFVDYCGTIYDVRMARNRHIKLFPDSARTGLHQQSSKCRSLKLIEDKRSVALPNQPSGDSSSYLHVHLSSLDKKMSSQKNHEAPSDTHNDQLMLPENHVKSDDAATCRLQFMESDDKAEEQERELYLTVSEKARDNDPENNVSTADFLKVKEASLEVAKHLGSCSESDVSLENLLLQTASEKQSSQAIEIDACSQKVVEIEPEELKPLSVMSLSLNPQESTCPDSGPMTSQECEAIPESCKSYGRTVVGGHTASQDNSASTQDSESAQIRIEIDSPHSAFHQDHRARRPLLLPESSRNSGGNWHQMRNGGKFRRGSKYGYRGYTLRKQHQWQKLSPQQIHPAEGEAQMPVTPGYTSQSVLQVQQCNQEQNQFQATGTTTDFVATQSWRTQNIQLHNSLSQWQPSADATLHVQHAIQGNGQYAYMQNGQEYNQIWQYYYYQQQQLQLQQHHIQLQQEAFQHEQSQQPQQIQLGQLQPQQLLQLQMQQQVLLQQQQQQLHFQQPQQQEHRVYQLQLQPSTQSSCHPIMDQGQAIAASQGHGTISSQHSAKPGLVSSPVPPPP